MGIRYYACPVRASDVELARSNPRHFLADYSLSDAWEPSGSMPRILDLDKAWRQLQDFFDSKVPRALPLVDGNVTHVQYGWIPHISVLDPDQVHDIALALSTVGEVDVLAARFRTFGGMVSSTTTPTNSGTSWSTSTPRRASHPHWRATDWGLST